MSYQLNATGLVAEITLDLSGNTSRNVIKAKQSDGSRKILLSVSENEQIIRTKNDIANANITIRVQRPDGVLITSTVPMNLTGEITEEGRINSFVSQEFVLSPEMLGVAGRAYCDFLLEYQVVDGSSYEAVSMSTEGFYIDIEPAPTDKSNVYDTPYNETQTETATDYVREVTS